MTDTAEKGCKADASRLAHLFQNCFFGFQLNLSSKLPLGLKNFLSFWLKYFPFLTKASLFQMEKCFKTQPISSLFTKKAILTPFST
jgi:hypothetical protein